MKGKQCLKRPFLGTPNSFLGRGAHLFNLFSRGRVELCGRILISFDLCYAPRNLPLHPAGMKPVTWAVVDVAAVKVLGSIRQLE
jgi:hypothetical protein